jgi:hypothetical protein
MLPARPAGRGVYKNPDALDLSSVRDDSGERSLQGGYSEFIVPVETTLELYPVSSHIDSLRLSERQAKQNLRVPKENTYEIES